MIFFTILATNYELLSQSFLKLKVTYIMRDDDNRTVLEGLCTLGGRLGTRISDSLMTSRLLFTLIHCYSSWLLFYYSSSHVHSALHGILISIALANRYLRPIKRQRDLLQSLDSYSGLTVPISPGIFTMFSEVYAYPAPFPISLEPQLFESSKMGIRWVLNYAFML